MTDIEKASQLFRRAGLSFPTIPDVLAVRLKERDHWVFSTRPLKMSPYNLQHYEEELERGLVKDYAVLAHSGHGVNSYAIQYYLVYGSLRMFLHLGWGGHYMDSKADEAKIRACFAMADSVVTAASSKGRFETGERLTIVACDFYGSYWLPPGESETRRTKEPLQALTNALGWLTQLSLFNDGKPEIRRKPAGFADKSPRPSEGRGRKTAPVRGGRRKNTSTSEKTLKNPSDGNSKPRGRSSQKATDGDTVRETSRGSESNENPAQWLDEARGDSAFKSFWRSSDARTRAYVFACFTLAELATLGPEDRASVFHQIAVAPRSAVLSRLAGGTVVSGALKIVERCEATAFLRADWIALFRAIDEPATRRAMSHLGRVSPILVRQLDSIPVPMRRPALLRVMNELPVDPDHWQELAAALEKAGPNRRATLVRGAGTIEGVGDFWDLFHQCRDAAMTETMSSRDAVHLGPEFAALTSASAMRREGLRMRNCLGRLVDKAARGQSAYFAWLGSERATVELAPVEGQWRLGPVRGAENAPVSVPTATDILAAVAAALGPRLIRDQRSSSPEVLPSGFERCIEISQREFSAAERAEVARVIWSIHGRSMGPRNGAYVVLEVGEGYFQCLADMGSNYFLEFSSHKHVSTVARYLTSDVVRLLDESGFDWPRRQANFARVLRVDSPAVSANLADFALGALWKIFELRSIDTLRTKVHFPTTAAGLARPAG